MRYHRIGLPVLATMLLGLASLTYATPITVTETFGSAASTAADGWVGYNNTSAGNDFGFSNTGVVSGPAGEVGGIFASSNVLRYFADTTLGGSLSRTETLVLSGSLRLTDDDFNGAIIIGYFNTGVLNDGPFIGIGIYEPAPSSVTFRAHARIESEGGSHILSNIVDLSQGITYPFNLTWTGNSDGSGTLSGTIAGTFVSITQGASVDTFNAFGIASGFCGATDPAQHSGPSYFDTLSYSSYSPNLPPIPAVPEPSTMLLLGSGLAALVGVRKKFRKD